MTNEQIDIALRLFERYVVVQEQVLELLTVRVAALRAAEERAAAADERLTAIRDREASAQEAMAANGIAFTGNIKGDVTQRQATEPSGAAKEET